MRGGCLLTHSSSACLVVRSWLMVEAVDPLASKQSFLVARIARQVDATKILKRDYNESASQK